MKISGPGVKSISGCTTNLLMMYCSRGAKLDGNPGYHFYKQNQKYYRVNLLQISIISPSRAQKRRIITQKASKAADTLKGLFKSLTLY